ncbi:DNA-binding transcriptional regulator, MerR family [Evansella caseinilytica]|uniref:DNA-binding transcriptional regulator, MerR family n=1 Tax=Evansella caseinilytica TaxID=1503961 RepID=A0A1H3PD72_9BACI|nr:MerR family transcriptional regulator [Evansella caseinilytica]SDY99102.1 DNA-binding transcriptional regulator, MerR family [Evansella caseinilytica]
MIKPIDIARKLKISTSALRHYEAWGIIPKVERGQNGYRLYTEEHVAYFECIRAMYPGFGMNVVRKTMPLIQKGKLTEALWIVNEVQVKLHEDKQKAERALHVLEQEQLEPLPGGQQKSWYTIGEAASVIGVPNSTLRHWEKENLIVPQRDLESGYRKYGRQDLRKLLVIRTLQTAVYSLDIVREVLDEMDQHNIAHAIKITRDSLVYMDHLIMEQLRGMSYLYKLCSVASKT